MSKPSELDNSLTQEDDDKIDDLRIEISRLREQVGALGRHRTYSLAITKLEEADHWLRARKTASADAV